MKVLMVTPFAKPVVGGISNFVHKVSEALNRQESIECWTLAQKGSNTDDVVAVDGGLFGLVLKALTLIRRFRPQVIHAHSDWRSLMVAVIMKSLNPDVKTFFTFHTEFVRPPRGLRKRIFELLLNRCEGVTFSSKYLQKRMAEFFSLPKVGVVSYPGVSPITVHEKIKKEFKELYELEDRYPILVFVGPLVFEGKAKGVRILIGALQELVDRGWNPVLLVVGDGPLKESLVDHSSRLRLDEFVKFAGFVERVEVPLACCDIYTHISLHESLGMSILEAMIQGKPVVSNEAGGIPEIVIDGETGVLVAPEPSEVAAGIIELASDKERMALLGQNSFRYVKRKFSWERTGRTILNVYSRGPMQEN